jgi:hypothetical protein
MISGAELNSEYHGTLIAHRPFLDHPGISFGTVYLTPLNFIPQITYETASLPLE